jgi:gamma-glutamyltranspeptidase / glutathione hydrolase
VPTSRTRRFDRPGRSPVMAPNAMASTSHPLATATALNILREGGNAVDAAIAASATLCVVEPHMTGIGGDCFAMVCEPDGTLYAINGSGRSPAGAATEWYIERGCREIGLTSPHSVTAPGAVMAWHGLHTRFGRMDFARLFADAVGYAVNGYPVHARVARDWRMQVPKLAADPGAARHYLVDGRSPSAGDVFHAPALGQVLARIAIDGPAAFYRGEVAREIAQTVQALGGFLSEEDLGTVDSDWVDPISAIYRGHEIFELPPNGQGITALVLLRLLALSGLPRDPSGGERYFTQTELARLAYGVRDTHVGDPHDMQTEPEALLSDSFIRALFAQFDPLRRNDAILLPAPRQSDTIYLAVVDSELRCVSFINSLYSGFGSGIVTPDSGIVLHNRGSCFVVEAGHVNCIGPSKRPLHTIIPGMAKKNGRAAMTFGVMGGSFQPLGHAQLLVNVLDYGMDPQAAIDHPRLFWEERGNLLAESGIGSAARRYLRERGFSVASGGPHGGGQIIVIDQDRGVLCAGSDPRKDGQAAGY